METIADLLEEQIKDLYSAETQLVKALPKMIKSVSDSKLKTALEKHLQETRQHVERLKTAADHLEIKPTGQMCHGMKGLLEEGSEAAGEDGHDAVIDAAIIVAAQRVEHYEISGYGSARALAELLGEDQVCKLLDKTLDEDSAADEKLTSIAKSSIYPNAPLEDGEAEEAAPKRKTKKR